MRDGAVLEDAEKLQSAADLQLVVLPAFVEVLRNRVQIFVDAARSGRVPEVEKMLQLPVDPDELIFGQTPLGAACAGGHAEVVRLLLFAGASKTTDRITTSIVQMGQHRYTWHPRAATQR